MWIHIAVTCCWLSWGATGQHYQIETSPHLTSPRSIVSSSSVVNLKNLIEEESSTPRSRRDDTSLSYGVYPLVVEPAWDPRVVKSGLVPIVHLDRVAVPPPTGMIDHGGGVYSFSYSAGDHVRKGPPKGRLTSFYYIANQEGMTADGWPGQGWTQYGTGGVGVASHGDRGLIPEYPAERIDVSSDSAYRPKLTNGPYRPVHLAPVAPPTPGPPSPFSKPVFVPNTQEARPCRYPDCYFEDTPGPPAAYPRGGTSRALFTQRPEVQYRVTKRAEPEPHRNRILTQEPKVVVITTPAPTRPRYVTVTVPSRTRTSSPRVITPRAVTPRTYTSRTVTSKSSTVSSKSFRTTSKPRVITARSTTTKVRTYKTTQAPKMVTAKAILITPPQPSHTMRIKPPKKHVQKIPPPKNNSNSTAVSPSKNILHSFTILARNGLNKNIHAKDEEFYISSVGSNKAK